MSRDVLHAFSPTLKCKASGCYKKLSLVTGLAGRVVKEAFIYDVYLENCSLYRLGLTDWSLRLTWPTKRGESLIGEEERKLTQQIHMQINFLKKFKNIIFKSFFFFFTILNWTENGYLYKSFYQLYVSKFKIM